MLRRLFSKAHESKSEYYIWSVDGKPVTIHLNLELVGKLATMAKEGLNALPRRGLEIGGLLLGRVSTPNADQTLVAVEQVETFEIEHLRGPSFTLSADDKAELAKTIRHNASRRDGLRVVGFFRSHTRPGLYMDEYDNDVFKSFFAHPASVALLVRPAHDTPSTGGFFFWDNGEVHRANTLKDFPMVVEVLRGDKREPAAASGKAAFSAAAGSELTASDPTGPRSDGGERSKARPSAGPATEQAAREIPVLHSTGRETTVLEPAMAAASTGATASMVTVSADSMSAATAKPISMTTVDGAVPFGGAGTTALAEPEAMPPRFSPRSDARSAQTAPPEPESEVGRDKPDLRSKLLFLPKRGGTSWQRWAWAPMGIAMIVFAMMPWYRPFGSGATSRFEEAPLSLNAEPQGSGLKLTWDRSNSVLQDAKSARLFIHDGPTNKELTLDAAQLRNGALLYAPSTQDVVFRLQVGELSESLRAVGAILPSSAGGLEPGSIRTASPESMAANSAPLQTRSRRAVRVAPPIAMLPGDSDQGATAGSSSAEAGELPTSPEIASAVPAKLDEPPISREVSRPRSFTNVEPQKESGFKKVVGAIPNIFRGRKPSGEDFVPARPVRRVQPNVPSSVKLDNTAKVSVKVSLDQTGRVRGADLVTRRVDGRLAEAAMDAARQWRFEPARVDRKAVSSSVVLHFSFVGSGS